MSGSPGWAQAILCLLFYLYMQLGYYKLQKRNQFGSVCGTIEDGQFLWMCMCSGHDCVCVMTERSNERKGFKYLSVYSKHAQAAIKNINAAIWSSSGSSWPLGRF